MSLSLSVGGTKLEASDPTSVDLLCFCSTPRRFAAFEARLRRTAAELGPGIRVLFASSADAEAARAAGAFVSATFPTVIAVVCGRVVAQAVGDLPIRELKTLAAIALRNASAAR